MRSEGRKGGASASSSETGYHGNKESLIETLTACTAAKEMETGRLAQIEVTIQNHIKGKERIAGIEKELEEKTLSTRIGRN